MKLHQLRFFCEIVDQGMNVSSAAHALHTSQPSVSRQVQALETELGVEVFTRAKKRILGLTPPGAEVLRVARRMLQDSHNVTRIGQDFMSRADGELIIAASHTHTRYALPKVIKQFAKSHPSVRLSLRQGTPNQIVNWISTGQADLAISTQPLDPPAEVVFMRCYTVDRIVLVPARHPLLRLKRISLEDIVRYPLITYEAEFVGYGQDLRSFEKRGLKPNIVLRATDADVMKTYVREGLGVAIIAAMAYDPKHDAPSKALDASHLFPPNTIALEVRRHQYLRDYAYDFIELFEPALTREKVKAALFD
ncbi:MAG: LysR family transcriptional regulator [Proteobacteria bacterium]|nr:LysR family transcriptional regulator [Burkholderiales bacterium]